MLRNRCFWLGWFKGSRDGRRSWRACPVDVLARAATSPSSPSSPAVAAHAHRSFTPMPRIVCESCI